MTASSGPLRGLMMDSPLTLTAILRRAAQVYPEKEIVSRRYDGTTVRYTYRDLYRRVVRLMNVLRGLGVRPGDRVASFAWNSDRHLELYFAVPCLGAVLNTVNIRLSPEQISFILRHAEDRTIFVDRSLMGSLSAGCGPGSPVETVVVMEDGSGQEADLPGHLLDYERLMESADDHVHFPHLDESTAAILCYTSGTTGDPKGVLYSHRSVYLHAMGCCMADSFCVRERETVLVAVPMFHANAWGLPFACALTGAVQVHPGCHLLGKPLADIIEHERVTFSAGVPTVWNLLFEHLRQHPRDVSTLRTIGCGGSAVPATLVEGYAREFGIELISAWGMTETSPVGTVCRLKASVLARPLNDQVTYRVKQGLPVAGVEMRIEDEEGRDLPWDGVSVGEVAVRGPWVAASYYNDASSSAAFTEDGWFRTGDIATIDELGYMQICDRKKDVIKSRGEWISSVDMENTVLAHPDVLEAAVVARPDKLRDEAPVLFVVLRDPSRTLSVPSILDALKTRFATWQLPRRTDVRFVGSLPRTSVGKLDKKELRARLAEEAGAGG